MAVFGFHIVLTMIVASLIHKLSPYYSFGRWFMIRSLHYYDVPLDTTLLPHIASGRDSDSNRHSKTKLLPLNNNLFLKRTTDIPLRSLPINRAVILLSFYYKEIKWLLDLFLASLVIFLVTFGAYVIQPAWRLNYVNLSAAWCGFVLIYALILLGNLTSIYLSSELAKERVSQIVLSAFLFVFSLGILPMDNNWFDFKLRSGHHAFIDSLMTTLLSVNNTSVEKAIIEHYIPYWVYIAVLIAVSNLIGALMVFPSLNYSKLHFETLTKNQGFFLRTLLHFNYILPLVSASLWLSPIGGKWKVQPSSASLHVASSFPVYRMILIFLLCSVRFGLFQLHMSTYLLRANDSLSDLRAVKSKVTVGEFKRKVKSIFSFYGGTALQYIGPVVVLLSLHLLSLISSSYAGFFLTDSEDEVDSPPPAPNVFNLSVYAAPLSFLSWWMLFVMFFMSSFGSLFHTSIQLG